MLDLTTLFFRVERRDWEGCVYFFEFPTQAYASFADAEDGLPVTHIVVTWAKMAERVYHDIHADA